MSFADLADELRVSPEELVPLVTAGYLVIVQTADVLKDTLVGKPTQNMIDWFRAMFGPVALRPMVPIKEVAAMALVKLDHFIELCERFHLPIYDDPIFGGLVSPRTVITFYGKYRQTMMPVRVDRVTLIDFLGRMKGFKVKRPIRLVEVFWKSFDEEIKRIAALPEPQRTIAATAFWQMFNDADLFTDLIKAEKRPGGTRNYYRRYKFLKEKADAVGKILKGKSTWDKQPYKLTCRGNVFHPQFGFRSKLAISRSMSAAMTEYWKKRKAAEAALGIKSKKDARAE